MLYSPINKNKTTGLMPNRIDTFLRAVPPCTSAWLKSFYTFRLEVGRGLYALVFFLSLTLSYLPYAYGMVDNVLTDRERWIFIIVTGAVTLGVFMPIAAARAKSLGLNKRIGGGLLTLAFLSFPFVLLLPENIGEHAATSWLVLVQLLLIPLVVLPMLISPYKDFQGQEGRVPFIIIWGTFIATLYLLAAVVFSVSTSLQAQLNFMLFKMLLPLLLMASMVRRLHDMGLKGWWALTFYQFLIFDKLFIASGFAEMPPWLVNAQHISWYVALGVVIILAVAPGTAVQNKLIQKGK